MTRKSPGLTIPIPFQFHSNFTLGTTDLLARGIDNGQSFDWYSPHSFVHIVSVPHLTQARGANLSHHTRTQVTSLLMLACHSGSLGRKTRQKDEPQRHGWWSYVIVGSSPSRDDESVEKEHVNEVKTGKEERKSEGKQREK